MTALPQDAATKTPPTPVKGVKAAQAALDRMQGELREGLLRDVAKLEARRLEIKAQGVGPQTVGQLYMRAHDIKSLGATCGYPSVSAIAQSLCRLIDDDTYEFERQVGLVDDHIDAIKAVLGREIRDAEDPFAQSLLAELKRDMEYR